jgi:hypothetical protein
MDFESLVTALVDDGIPIANLLRLQDGFTSTVNALISMLVKGTAQNQEEQQSLVEDAQATLKMLQMADILAIDGEVVTPGKIFSDFREFASDFFSLDNTVIRSLKMSRQEFDEIKREYMEVTSQSREFANILTAWSELPPESKCGIIRGIFIQRGIMASILGSATKSLRNMSDHCNRSADWMSQWTTE